jgi:5-formyltetrahydrofolate cyclo-ligase
VGFEGTFSGEGQETGYSLTQALKKKSKHNRSPKNLMTERKLSDIQTEKKILREKIWRRLTEAGVARFPGAFGRIPNFVGAERAADLMAQREEFQKARFLKANPDSPQFPLRVLALQQGKTIFMAVPKLKSPKPFLRLDPQRLKVHPMRAATIKGSFKYGEPVSPEEMPPIELVITGCVAVTREGHRLGKGGGYSELELAVLKEYGLLSDEVPIVTTVHPLQIVSHLPLEDHDFTVDLVATPEEVFRCSGQRRRPRGILWEKLSEEKMDSIPILKQLKTFHVKQ